MQAGSPWTPCPIVTLALDKAGQKGWHDYGAGSPT